MSAEASPVRYEVADGVATVTLDRPDAMNALDTATKEALRDAVHRAASDDEARAVVLTGTGRAFCVGQDLKEHVEGLRSDRPAPLSDTVEAHYNPTVTALATMPKPVVAAVNGVAAGAGASLTFACDFRILAESASYNLAFASIALSCDTGASWTLPRLVGHARATDLLMRPRTIHAGEAEVLGLATEVVPTDRLAEDAHAFAARLAAGPTLALASIKRALAYSATHDLATSLIHEAQKMAFTGSSADHAAAVDSFLAKQKPVFQGR
ncbi:enoyl-CoA hydratase-related protein [Solicola sp. PLA-1-18]|uniref:enoyl-CoA hydratase-related protein n=1 Tax=Solicola sp. PLA-1-18 TaxID=3380532 RepID=UPI003B7D6D1D